MPTPTLNLAVNVPVDFRLKFIDVWPNDLSKNNGKGYGASLSLTGEVEGAAQRIYPKGFLNRNLEKLVWAGVVEEGHYPHDPEEKYSIPVKASEIRIVNAQPAGEKYPAFDILNVKGVMIPPKPKGHGNGAIPPPTSSPSVDGGSSTDPTTREETIRAAKALHATALKQANEYVLKFIEPLYAEKQIGLTGDECYKQAYTIFQTWEDKGLVE